MTRETDGTERAAGFAPTRRDALKLGGGATAAVFVAAGMGRGAAAQDATPVASPVAGGLVGQYLVVRTRALVPGRSGEELLGLIREGFVPLLEAVPGFVSYLAVANDETGDQFSVGVYADKTGADESNQQAEDWGPVSGAVDYVEGDPEISEGVIGVAAEAVEALPSGDSSPAAVPQATPVTDDGLEGKYLAVRLRQPNPEWPADEVLRLIDEGHVPLVREIPGFVAYFGSANADSGDQAYVVICDDKAGTDESTRVAGEWLTENSYDFFTGDPIVAEGVIGVAAEAAM